MPQSCPLMALGLSALSHSGTGLVGLQLCSTFGDLGCPHTLFFPFPLLPLALQLAMGVGLCPCFVPELPKCAAPLSPCGSSSPGGTKTLSPTFGFCPPLGTTGSRQRVPPVLLRFSGSLRLQFSLCFHHCCYHPAFCFLPSVPRPIIWLTA